MTTTQSVREAVVQTLATYLPVELETAGLPEMPVQAMKDRNDLRTEQFPRVYVHIQQQQEQQGPIGDTGYTPCLYTVGVTFGVKSQVGSRDIEAWVMGVADCLRCVLEKYWRIPWPDADSVTGLASTSDVQDCEYDSYAQGSQSVMAGLLTFTCVVERLRKTSGAE